MMDIGIQSGYRSEYTQESTTTTRDYNDYFNMLQEAVKDTHSTSVLRSTSIDSSFSLRQRGDLDMCGRRKSETCRSEREKRGAITHLDVWRERIDGVVIVDGLVRLGTDVDRVGGLSQREVVVEECIELVSGSFVECGGGGVGCGGTAAGEEGRVRESDLGDWVDPVTRIIFGVHRKLRRKSFRAVHGWWPECWPEKKVGRPSWCKWGPAWGNVRHTERGIDVSGKTEKLSGISFYIELL
ncbi:hypothetical protein Tco_0715983 [Tanacetum coccineum]